MRSKDTAASLVEELRKKYGAGSIRLAAECASPSRLPTGVPALDAILGGGWPKGRISEIWGINGAGKSTLALACAAATQRAWSPPTPKTMVPVKWFDQENTFDPAWARLLGVDLDRMVVHAPMAAEDCGDLVLSYVRGRIPLVVIDSIIEMLPEKSLLRASGEHEYSPVARFLASWLPKVVVLQGRSPTVLLLINQVRDRIGFFLGDSERSPGGHVLAHLNTVKLKVTRRGWIKQGDRKVGYSTAIKVVKSKVGGETLECRYDMRFGQGIVITNGPDPEIVPDEE